MRIGWSFYFDENTNRNMCVKARQFLAPPLVLSASDANGQTSPIASSTATDLLIALTGKRLAKLNPAMRVLAR